MRVIKGKSSLVLARMTSFELLHLAYSNPPPDTLDGLTTPREPDARLGALNTAQRQVAGLMLELADLHNLIQGGDQWRHPHLQSLTLHGLNQHISWIWGNLYSEASNQVVLESWQEHIEIADDGNIYACPGDCPKCVNEKVVTAERRYPAAIRPPDNRLN